MIKIKHINDIDVDSKLVSELSFDNDTLIYNEHTDEMFRFVKPDDTNQLFGIWKTKLPRYDFRRIGGGMTANRSMGSLTENFDLFNESEIFSSTLAPLFILNTNIYWQKKIGGVGNESGLGIAVDISGNVYLNGVQSSDSYGDNDYGVIKLDSSGNIVWQKKIGGILADVGYAICLDLSGNIYITGYQASDSEGLRDYGVIKLDNNGNILWQRKIGGTGDDIGNDIAVDSLGNVYLNGYQPSDSYGNNDYGVIKLDSNGNEVWQKKIGGLADDRGVGIAIDSSDNIYLTGYQYSSSEGLRDYGVIKLDTNGNILWQKKIGGSNIDSGRSIAVDGSGNVYLNGYYKHEAILNNDYGVIKLDTNGTMLWQKKIGGIEEDAGTAICVSDDGIIYLNGYQFSDSFGSNDYGVIKLNTDQESDMNFVIGDMTLPIHTMTLSIAPMNIVIEPMSLSVSDMNLSIDDIDISGTLINTLRYIG